MSTSPIAMRPTPAPWTMPRTTGRATSKASTPPTRSEAPGVLRFGPVLVAAAVRLEHVDRGSPEAALGEVGHRVHAGVEALALDGGYEPLTGQGPPCHLELGGEKLLSPPQGEADVVAV